MQIILIGSVILPISIVMLFILTICIVLCVYLKENFKGLKRVLLNSERGETRPDKDYENEMLRKRFTRDGPDHIELNEELDEEDEELRD